MTGFTSDWTKNLHTVCGELNKVVDQLPSELKKMEANMTEQEIKKYKEALSSSDIEGKMKEFSEIRNQVMNQMNDHLK